MRVRTIRASNADAQAREKLTGATTAAARSDRRRSRCQNSARSLPVHLRHRMKTFRSTADPGDPPRASILLTWPSLRLAFARTFAQSLLVLERSGAALSASDGSSAVAAQSSGHRWTFSSRTDSDERRFTARVDFSSGRTGAMDARSKKDRRTGSEERHDGHVRRAR